MSDLFRFFKHSSIYAIGNVINRIGAFVLLPVYTSYLSVEEYGTLELFYVVLSVVAGILAVGLSHATLRFYYEYKDDDERKASISTNYIGSLLITLVGVSCIALFSGQISHVVFESEVLQLGILLVLGTTVFELSSQICLAYIRAIEYSVFFIVISIIKLVVQVSVNTILVIFYEAGITGVLIGNLCAVFLGWAILSGFTIARCGFRFHLHKFIPVIHYSLPFLFSTIVGIAAAQADKVLLNRLVSIEALGIYALSLKFSMILDHLVGEPFNRSFGAFRYTIMEKDDAPQIQAQIVKYLAIIAVLFGLGISFFAEDLVHVMSDESFWPATQLVPIVMIAAVVRLLVYPAQTGILYAKKTKYLPYILMVTLVVSVASNLLLINVIGIYGVCIALIVTELVTLFVTHKISQRFFRVNYDYPRLIAIFGLAILVYIPVYFIALESFVASIVVKLMLIALFCIAIAILPILTSTEKSQVRQFIMITLGRQA